MIPITKIKYKNRTIKVTFENIKDFAVYYHEEKKLVFRKNLSSKFFLKTLFHELFHIIIATNEFSVSKHGEEKVAGLTEEYYTVLKQNPKLRKIILNLI
jgi:Zn-dependent peptidase ImmA (M78 family)